MYRIIMVVLKWILIGYIVGAVGWFLYVLLTPDDRFSSWQSRVPFAVVMAIVWPWLSIAIPLHERKIKNGYYDIPKDNNA